MSNNDKFKVGDYVVYTTHYELEPSHSIGLVTNINHCCRHTHLNYNISVTWLSGWIKEKAFINGFDFNSVMYKESVPLDKLELALYLLA